jgi:hypothetical protein
MLGQQAVGIAQIAKETGLTRQTVYRRPLGTQSALAAVRRTLVVTITIPTVGTEVEVDGSTNAAGEILGPAFAPQPSGEWGVVHAQGDAG